MNSKSQSRKKKYFKEVVSAKLKEKFSYRNDLEVPSLQKIVISRGVNADEARSSNVLDELVKDITLISGQKPVLKKAKKSIASFKIRDGMINGIMVTLRNEKMYTFFDKFVSLAAPRIRDFRGFDVKGDPEGNFTVGIPDQRIFLERETASKVGLQLVIVTSASSNKEGKALLEEMGFPFSKK